MASCVLDKEGISSLGWFDEGGENTIVHIFFLTADGKLRFTR